VWGFDFNPAHIEFASDLAARAGLANAHFAETSFADLDTPDAALPDLDIAVSHGVLSWISPANRRHLISAIARRLKPGGLVYLGYNVTTGWTSMLPLQALMRMLTAASPERTDLAVPAMLDYLDRLKQAGALFFQANPAAETRLADIRKHEHRYIAHEYLNQDWHPTPSRCRPAWHRCWRRCAIRSCARRCAISAATSRSGATSTARASHRCRPPSSSSCWRR
jgi:SAM-dependent methyltransferase